MKKIITRKNLLCVLICVICSFFSGGSDKNNNDQYHQIDLFENVSVVNYLDFKYADSINTDAFYENKITWYNIYPVYGYVDGAQNPYFREFWSETYPECDQEDINKCLAQRCIYCVNDQKSSVTPYEQKIYVEFLLGNDSQRSDLDSIKFNQFLENHHYRIKSLSKEYIIRPEDNDSEIVNEDMYTDDIAGDINDIITYELSKHQELSGYQEYQKYLLIPNDEFVFENHINGGGNGYSIHWNMFCILGENDFPLGMSVILKDDYSQTYVVMRIKMVIRNQQIIDYYIMFGTNYQEDETEIGHYSSIEECNQHLLDWSSRGQVNAVSV